MRFTCEEFTGQPCSCPQPSVDVAPRVELASHLFHLRHQTNGNLWAQACWDAAGEALEDDLDADTAMVLAMTLYVGMTQ